MRRLPSSAAVVACALVCGCSYVKNRTNDLLDPFHLDVGYSPGLYVDARATDFAAIGLGARGGHMVGVHGRFAVSYTTVNVALGPVMLGDVIRPEASALLGGESAYDRNHDILPGQMFFIPLLGSEHAPDWSLERRGVHVADFGANVAVGIVGAGIGFSPGEFVDLLLGFVGIDIAGDDVSGRPPTPSEGAPVDQGAEPR